MAHMRKGRQRVAVPLEKVEQAHIVQLARSIGAKVYVIGTRRSRGSKCGKCGTFVPEGQSTRQTAGHADLVIFLPGAVLSTALNAAFDLHKRRLLYWETKRAEGGRLSDEQEEFLSLAVDAGVDIGVGSFDRFIAWLTANGYLKPENVPHYRRPAVADWPPHLER